MTRDEYVARVLALSEQEMAVALLLAAGSEQQAVCEQLIGRMKDARQDAARAAAARSAPCGPYCDHARHGGVPVTRPAAAAEAGQP